MSVYVNKDAYAQLPKPYQAIVARAAEASSLETIAKYDAENAAALRRLVAQGAKLRAFPKDVMDACYAESAKGLRGVQRQGRAFQEAA